MEQLDTAKSWESGLVPANDGLNVDNHVSQIDSTKEFLIEVRDLRQLSRFDCSCCHGWGLHTQLSEMKILLKRNGCSKELETRLHCLLAETGGQRGVGGLRMGEELLKLCWMQWLACWSTHIAPYKATPYPYNPLNINRIKAKERLEAVALIE